MRAKATHLWNGRATHALARVRVTVGTVSTSTVTTHIARRPVALKATVANAVTVPAPRCRRHRSWPEEPANRCGACPGEESRHHPPPTNLPAELACEVVNQCRFHVSPPAPCPARTWGTSPDLVRRQEGRRTASHATPRPARVHGKKYSFLRHTLKVPESLACWNWWNRYAAGSPIAARSLNMDCYPATGLITLYPE